MTRLTRSSLEDPTMRRALGRGVGNLAHAGPLDVGRATLPPGWSWSTDLKPIVGTPSCLIHHIHVLLAGRFGVRLDDGEEAIFEPGDVFEIPPGHDTWVVGDTPVELLDISGNVAELGLPATSSRAVATLLMTDIVESTAHLARLGDQGWKQVLAGHDRLVRSELRRAQGREVATTGDGFLAEFGSAAGALDCALRVREAVRALAVEVRVGVHTGEIERADGDVRGLSVHTTARVMAIAAPSEVLTTTVTRLLSTGGPYRFEPRGAHPLKGLPAPVELFAVAPA